jgi:hypothetical protein
MSIQEISPIQEFNFSPKKMIYVNLAIAFKIQQIAL